MTSPEGRKKYSARNEDLGYQPFPTQEMTDYMMKVAPGVHEKLGDVFLGAFLKGIKGFKFGGPKKNTGTKSEYSAPKSVVDDLSVPYLERYKDGSAFYALGHLDDHGIIGNLSRTGVLDIEAIANASKGRGKDLFNGMVDALGKKNIKAIEGNWFYGDNLSAFRKNLDRGMTPKAAAQGTWTGEMARRIGFTNVEIVRNSGVVKVIFTRP